MVIRLLNYLFFSEMSDKEESVPKIEFKKKSRKPLRKREQLNEEEIDDDDDNTLRYVLLILFIIFHL